jgi:hypothetical protein
MKMNRLILAVLLPLLVLVLPAFAPAESFITSVSPARPITLRFKPSSMPRRWEDKATVKRSIEELHSIQSQAADRIEKILAEVEKRATLA